MAISTFIDAKINAMRPVASTLLSIVFISACQTGGISELNLEGRYQRIDSNRYSKLVESLEIKVLGKNGSNAVQLKFSSYEKWYVKNELGDTTYNDPTFRDGVLDHKTGAIVTPDPLITYYFDPMAKTISINDQTYYKK